MTCSRALGPGCLGSSGASPRSRGLPLLRFLGEPAGGSPDRSCGSRPRGGGGGTSVSSGASRQRWRLRIGDTTGLTVVDGVVYVSGKSEIYALDAATGRQRWQFSTEQYWNDLSAPAVADGVVYFGSKHADGHLYAMDTLTGQQLWRTTTGSLATSPVTVDGSCVYIGTLSGLCAVDSATGQQRWGFSGGTVLARPTAAAGVVYASVAHQDGGGGLYALDAVTGEQKWTFSTGHEWKESSAAAVADGTVYYGSGHSLCAVDVSSGQERWRLDTGHWVTSNPLVVNGLVYAGSWDRHLYAVDAATGEVHWTFPTDGPLNSAPVVADDVVYVAGWHDRLYAVLAATGEAQWSFRAGGSGHAPAVVEGTVYVGSQDGYLYALDATTSAQPRDEDETAGPADQVPSPDVRDTPPPIWSWRRLRRRAG
ncbi:PQQ-binding-like beta-propeller repeat protein [Streptomyces sp. NPDC005283]|uniref:outer membrane protein assembly factor BamB family protein n=1 Tax=Streptomyces sp. NPDC005283 TaxID=3156871 RepID=UPI0034534605